jgi:hypothetical protein
MVALLYTLEGLGNGTFLYLCGTIRRLPSICSSDATDCLLTCSSQCPFHSENLNDILVVGPVLSLWNDSETFAGGRIAGALCQMNGGEEWGSLPLQCSPWYSAS